jgi:hypothetical protein
VGSSAITSADRVPPSSNANSPNARPGLMVLNRWRRKLFLFVRQMLTRPAANR